MLLACLLVVVVVFVVRDLCRDGCRFRVLSGVKTGSTLVCRPCDATSGNLNKTSARERSRGVDVQIG